MAYIYDLSDAWAASGTVFTGIKLNVTDTASAAASLLMDLQVGGVSRFRVGKTGSIVSAAGGIQVIADSVATDVLQGRWGPSLSALRAFITGGAGSFDVTSTGSFRFSNDTFGFATMDTILARDAANTLAQRNGVNAQAFNLYNTYTDASNYERGFMSWASNILTIGAANAGTGVLRQLRLVGAGVELSQGNVWVEPNFNQSIKLHGSYGIAWQAGGANAGTSNVARLSSTTTSGYGVELTVGLRLGAPVLHATTGYTVATLPTSPLVGMTTRVTDATTPTIGSTVTGGGAAAAMCWYNGTNWTVIGV